MAVGEKVILDLCGGTGAWSQPYKDAGYDVRVITLPEFDVFDVNFWQGHIFLKDDYNGIPVGDIYGILAAPPCTMFSMARTRAKTPRDMRKGMETVRAALEIIWACQYEGKLAFWAIENPTARLRWFLGKPAMTFQPLEFGDPYSKKTDLWGNFNTDLKRSPVILNRKQRKQRKQRQLNLRELPPIPKDYVRDPNMELRAIARSITSPGFAQAFFEANK